MKRKAAQATGSGSGGNGGGDSPAPGGGTSGRDGGRSGGRDGGRASGRGGRGRDSPSPAGGGDGSAPAAAAAVSALPPYITQDVPDDLVRVGRVVAQRDGEGEVSLAARLVLSVETFLTDLYRTSDWYLELQSVDDMEAVPRRGVMLLVTPLNDPSSATLSHMAMNDQGRMCLPDFVTAPRKVCGHAPRWFLDDLDTQMTAAVHDELDPSEPVSEDFIMLRWAIGISRHVQGPTVYIRQHELTRVRPWTLPLARLHAAAPPVP